MGFCGVPLGQESIFIIPYTFQFPVSSFAQYPSMLNCLLLEETCLHPCHGHHQNFHSGGKNEDKDKRSTSNGTNSYRCLLNSLVRKSETLTHFTKEDQYGSPVMPSCTSKRKEFAPTLSITRSSSNSETKLSIILQLQMDQNSIKLSDEIKGHRASPTFKEGVQCYSRPCKVKLFCKAQCSVNLDQCNFNTNPNETQMSAKIGASIMQVAPNAVSIVTVERSRKKGQLSR